MGADSKKTEINLKSDSQAFILMEAVIFIIETIFKKGIEEQIENDLTV